MWGRAPTIWRKAVHDQMWTSPLQPLYNCTETQMMHDPHFRKLRGPPQTLYPLWYLWFRLTHSPMSSEEIIKHFQNVVSICPNLELFPSQLPGPTFLHKPFSTTRWLAQVPKGTAADKQKSPPQRWREYFRVVAMVHVPSRRQWGKEPHFPLWAPRQDPSWFCKDCFSTLYRLLVSTQEEKTLMTPLLATVLMGFIQHKRGQLWQLTLVWGSCLALQWPLILHHHSLQR